MAKYWQIRESYGEKDMEDPKEAYECGYEEGYQAAMEELGEGPISERQRGYMGNRMGYRGGMGEGTMGNRVGGYMGERRSRDSMGRFR